jgi:hypothetical protein
MVGMLGAAVRAPPTKDYEPFVLREVLDAQKQAHLPHWSRPLTDLLKKWVVTGVVDAKATFLSMDAAESAHASEAQRKAARAGLWAGALETIFEHAQDERGLDHLAVVLRSQFHLQLSTGAEDASAWTAAVEKCAGLRDAPVRETPPEMFGSLDSDQKKRKKKMVDHKKKKSVAAYEARSLVQHVINETYNSEDSDVVSVPGSPTAAAEVDRQLLNKTKLQTNPREFSTTEPSSSCTSSTEDCEHTRKSRRAVHHAVLDPQVEELRLRFYAALKQQNATQAVERFQLELGSPPLDHDERILLHNQVAIAFHCLSNADWCRLQLWRAYSSGQTHAGEVLSQAEQCLRGFPELVAKVWCPRTGADVLGYIALSVPAKLLRSLANMVSGRPQFLRDLQRKADNMLCEMEPMEERPHQCWRI